MDGFPPALNAGIEYIDKHGLRADIHAMRTTYGSMIAKASIEPRTAMELLRHRVPPNDEDLFRSASIGTAAAAVMKLPHLPVPAPASLLESERSKSVSRKSAAIGSETTSIVADGIPSEKDITPACDDNWQQKTPSGEDGVLKRVKGVEPDQNLQNSAEKHDILESVAAKASARLLPPISADQLLTEVIAAWPTLSNPLKCAIRALISTESRSQE